MGAACEMVTAPTLLLPQGELLQQSSDPAGHTELAFQHHSPSFTAPKLHFVPAFCWFGAGGGEVML